MIAFFFIRGLGLPLCPFRGLLVYYGICLQHLNPNSITQLAIFIHLCEAYLGIAPHFNLWRYLFKAKPQCHQGQDLIVGGAGLQTRQGKKGQYSDITLPTTDSGWKSEWFYMINASGL